MEDALKKYAGPSQVFLGPLGGERREAAFPGGAHIRPPAVAGMFYPGDARELAGEVATLIEGAAVSPIVPKALIVPHAGYVYSGPVAASAYALLAPLRGRIRRVVLLGPAHRVPVHGLAAPVSTSFRTPLGRVPVDSDAIESALHLPQVNVGEVAHAQEHSLEVQLPFLQTVLDDFTLAPFVVGTASAREVAEVLVLLWGGPETLIVISSDLSHYHPYAEARQIDQGTADDIVHLRPLADHEQACGATPVNGLIEVARRKGLKPHLLDLRNSGDTAGDRSRVVGYCAIAFTEAGNG
ncbi:MAG: AmmeMemoRadiSam system protein B [Rhodocyclaceae bacterium]|nr:AmmeMemoRadiSam system protein B [Rhodocyclaceae bacterium]